ncbi:type II toxin-antitoxin system HicB family antitoxin [Crenobacter cavernae]|uniref:Type II toxin-antitoxin system HicB family antitoxin n=1 Tax=Crenobacter cavernae TaxID=2290923 RepID=A0ABY0FAN9_9NEIS|nr:type II toxin-antitoxin system HicB family antitoxin [Crenobacter cavernae]RXZ42722.1 type II toxin-antitoxin system HicB family antitoxin [Crenobacter cavernae]
MLIYPVTLTDEDNGVSVSFPDVPEALTFGETRDEALREAVDALLTALIIYQDERRAFPLPGALDSGNAAIALPLMGSLKLLLHNAMVEKGWRKADLARATGWAGSQIERALDPRYASKLDALETALAALGKRVSVQLVDR